MSTSNAIGTDQEFRHKAECLERFRVLIQDMLLCYENDFAVVFTAIVQGYVDAHLLAGMDKPDSEIWIDKLKRILDISAGEKIKVQTIYRPLEDEITRMIDQGFHPLAIAWAIKTVMINLTALLFGEDSPQQMMFEEGLVEQLQTTKNKTR